MQPLYISDLDGTLLNEHKVLSAYTKEVLSDFIRAGGLFTVATARTPATVVPLLKEVPINLPVIVMNGSFIFDIKTNKYIYTSEIPLHTVKEIISIVEAHHKQIFLYALENQGLNVYHKGFNNEEEKKFYEERKDLPLKTFVPVKDYQLTEDKKIGHMVMIEQYEVVQQIAEQLKVFKELKLLVYKDINTKDSYLLEISLAHVNKAYGISQLEKIIGKHEVTAFGDNLNDLEMIKGVEIGCAVANAEEALKKIADCVIKSNKEDGVAQYIAKKHYKKNIAKK